MKVIVVKPFIDKHTGVLYKAGQELTINQARYKEICSVGNFVNKVEKKSSGA